MRITEHIGDVHTEHLVHLVRARGFDAVRQSLGVSKAGLMSALNGRGVFPSTAVTIRKWLTGEGASEPRDGEGSKR